MDDERFENDARFSRLNMLHEQDMAFRKHEGCWIQSHEFLAGVAVHFTCRGVGFHHQVHLQIIDNQSIACGFEDVPILFFRSELSIGNLTYKFTFHQVQ